MAGFLKVLLRNVLQGPSTDPYPFGPTFDPEGIRGKVVIDPDKCMGCGMCAYTCPGGAINIEKRDDGHTITVYHNTCCKCANCQEYCPTGAITMCGDWHAAHAFEVQYDQYVQEKVAKERCPVCGNLRVRRPIPLELAQRLYAGKTDVDADHARQLCRACRQMEDAKRLYDSLAKDAAAK